MTVGENIKRIRKEKKLTQKSLGELCQPKSSESTIRKYELGILNPKIETIQKIANALGVSLNDLLPDSFEQTVRIGHDLIATDYSIIETLISHKIFYDEERQMILKQIEEHKSVLEKIEDSESVQEYGNRTFNELTHSILKMILDEFTNESVEDIVIILSCFLSLRDSEQQAIIEMLLNYCY